MSGYGMHGAVLFGPQASQDAVTVPNNYIALPIISESMTTNIETIQEGSMYGRFSQSPTHKGMVSVEGSIEMEVGDITAGYPLLAAIGSDTVAQVAATDLYTHTFDLSSADAPDDRWASQPIALEVYRDSGDAITYLGCVANTLEMTITNGELLTMNTGYVGAGFTRAAKTTTPDYADGGIFKWDSTCATYGGAAIVDLTDLTVSITKNIEPMYTLVACNSPYKMVRTDTEQVEISGTMIFQSDTYMEAYEDFSEAAFTAYFTIGTCGSLLISAPAMKFKSFTPNMSGKGLVEASFTADALFDETAKTALTITLTNTQVPAYNASQV